MNKTTIQHWRYEDGWHQIPNILQKNGVTREFNVETIGWHCWVYPAEDVQFLEWMDTHCSTAECVHRFNSGNPMYTVHITSEQEATAFSLRWL